MEKHLKTKMIFEGHVVKLKVDDVLCLNGLESKREVVMHNGGAAVLVIKNDEILLVKQYRYAMQDYIYEIPAGKLEINEDPKEAAFRELEEETGFKTDNLIDLGCVLPSVGYCNEVIYLYATDNIKEGILNLDEDEVIETKFFKLEEVKQMILDNKITDSKTIAAIYKYELLKQKNKKA